MKPGISRASPLEGCSTPAIIRSSVDLPVPFGPEDADLGSGQERERDVIEDDLVAVRLADTAHLIDELRHVIQG